MLEVETVGRKEGVRPQLFAAAASCFVLNTWKIVPLLGQLGSLGEERGDSCKFKNKAGA